MSNALELAKNVMKQYPSAVKKIMDVFLQNAERGLTLATLCDIALGEDAEDRSDDALIRAVRGMSTVIDLYREQADLVIRYLINEGIVKTDDARDEDLHSLVVEAIERIKK